MPPKRVKMQSGQVAILRSVRLPNGNLLIPRRMPHDRKICEWVEVKPGESDHKRWSTVAEDAPDPREDPVYRDWLAAVHHSERYQVWLRQQT